MFEAQTLALDAADPELAALFIAAIAAASTAASSRADAVSAHDDATSAQQSAGASSTAACNRGGARVYLAEGCG